MIEKECKILEINVDYVRTKLKEIGAELVAKGDVHSLYFDFPDERMKGCDLVLRLRNINGKDRLDFKKRIGSDDDHKVCEEHNVIVEDKESMVKILNALGLDVVKEHKKYRESYKYQNILIEIDIDEDKVIPAFLEIEAESKDDIEKGVKLLGYTMEDAKSFTGSDLARMYKR